METIMIFKLSALHGDLKRIDQKITTNDNNSVGAGAN